MQLSQPDIIGWRNIAAKNVHPLLARKVSKEIGYHSSKLKHGVGKSNHILGASCMMVGHLAGDLSYVTCKEPLCEKMPTQLRCFVQGLNVASKLLEHVMQLIDENLESGCESIEKAATDMELSVRRKHREAARHATFDPNLLAQGALLEAFHPQSGDISLKFSGFCSISVAKFQLIIEFIGIVKFRASRVDRWTVYPVRASARDIFRVTTRSLPSLLKKGCGFSSIVTTRSEGMIPGISFLSLHAVDPHQAISVSPLALSHLSLENYCVDTSIVLYLYVM